VTLDPGSLPAVPGAYLVAVRLSQPLALDLGGPGATTLAPGTYAYCGSARGPGGIRARVARHLRTAEKAHWHVDRLTAAGAVTAVALAPGGSECALFAAVSCLPGARVPAPGFGSSDCRTCAAHLARVDDAILAGAFGPAVTWLYA
jgi:Uri superfamily endonuclease